MTTGSEGVPKHDAHPDTATIAAHVERRLPRVEAARVEEHLAGCSACYEVRRDGPLPARRGGRGGRPRSRRCRATVASSGGAGGRRARARGRTGPGLVAPVACQQPARPAFARGRHRPRRRRAAVHRASAHRRLSLRALRPAALRRHATRPRRAAAGGDRRRRPDPGAGRDRHLTGGPLRARGHVSRLGRRERGRQGARVGGRAGAAGRAHPERPRRRLSHAREPARRAGRRPAGAGRRGKSGGPSGRARRGLVQPRPRARRPPPRRRGAQGVGRLPRARLGLGLGGRGAPPPRRPARRRDARPWRRTGSACARRSRRVLRASNA